VKIEKAGKYKVTIWSPGEFDGYSVTVGSNFEKAVRMKMKDSASFEMPLEAGPANVEAEVTSGKTTRGVTHVQLEYLGK
jgi:hypothetical protein